MYSSPRSRILTILSIPSGILRELRQKGYRIKDIAVAMGKSKGYVSLLLTFNSFRDSTDATGFDELQKIIKTSEVFQFLLGCYRGLRQIPG